MWLDYLSGVYSLFPEIVGKGKIMFGICYWQRKENKQDIFRSFVKIARNKQSPGLGAGKLTVSQLASPHCWTQDYYNASLRQKLRQTKHFCLWTALGPFQVLLKIWILKGELSAVTHGHCSTKVYLCQWISDLMFMKPSWDCQTHWNCWKVLEVESQRSQAWASISALPDFGVL